MTTLEHLDQINQDFGSSITMLREIVILAEKHGLAVELRSELPIVLQLSNVTAPQHSLAIGVQLKNDAILLWTSNQSEDPTVSKLGRALLGRPAPMDGWLARVELLVQRCAAGITINTYPAQLRVLQEQERLQVVRDLCAALDANLTDWEEPWPAPVEVSYYTDSDERGDETDWWLEVAAAECSQRVFLPQDIDELGSDLGQDRVDRIACWMLNQLWERLHPDQVHDYEDEDPYDPYVPQED